MTMTLAMCSLVAVLMRTMTLVAPCSGAIMKSISKVEPTAKVVVTSPVDSIAPALVTYNLVATRMPALAPLSPFGMEKPTAKVKLTATMNP